MTSTTDVTRRFTRNGAFTVANRLTRKDEKERGKSSGWSRVSYTVARRSDGIRKWAVVRRG